MDARIIRGVLVRNHVHMFLSSRLKRIHGRFFSSEQGFGETEADEVRSKAQACSTSRQKQYPEWLDRCGLSKNILAVAREEMLEHDALVDLESGLPSHPVL